MKPSGLGNEPVRNECRDRHSCHGCRCIYSKGGKYFRALRKILTIQCACGRRELAWTEQNDHGPTIPENTHKSHGLAPSTQIVSCLWEVLCCQDTTAQPDQAMAAANGTPVAEMRDVKATEAAKCYK